MFKSSLSRRLLLLMAILSIAQTAFVATSPAQATGPRTWWVATSGTPDGTASSCADPDYVGTEDAPIQSAINAAAAGDEIRICTGTYYMANGIAVGTGVSIIGEGDVLPTLDARHERSIMAISSTAGTVLVSKLNFLKGSVGGETDYGAAINQHPATNLTVTDSYFHQNRSVNSHGGAIALVGIDGQSNTGTLSVERSTFYKNSGVDGGAITVAGTTTPSSIKNSTFVSNTASRNGAAINASFATVTATNSTFIDNISGSEADATWSIGMKGNIVAYSPDIQPHAAACVRNGAPEPVNNISTESSCIATGEQAITYDSLQLQLLAPQGGFTMTAAIGATSSARGAVASANCLTDDQRTESRAGSTCDAGAYEYQVDGAFITPSSSSITILQGRAIDPSITFSSSGLTSPVNFTIATAVSAEFPAGVSFNSSTGEVSGTPTEQTAAIRFIVTATGANGKIASAALVVDNCQSTPVNGKYIISNADNLELFRIGACGRASSYLLTADISWDAAWSASYLENNPFTGTFDGGGHAITGLQMNGGPIAFIPWTNGATIKNLTYEVTAEGGYGTAGIVRSATATTISNVHGSGSIANPIAGNDKGCLGGIAGETWGSTTISDSSFEGTISSPGGSWNGGLVGCPAGNSLVQRSYFSGTIDGSDENGGIAGWMEDSEIRDSYAVGSVLGTAAETGGLVGWMGGTATDADVADIHNSYASVQVQGTSAVGGLVGTGSSTSISASHWEAGLTGNDGLNAIGALLDVGGTPPEISATPSSTMKSFAFFDDANWSIADGWENSTTSSKVWGICTNQTRPFLLWQHATSPCVAAQTPPAQDPPAQDPPASVPDTTPVASAPTTTVPATTSPTSTTSTIPATKSSAVLGPVVRAGGVAVLVGEKLTDSSLSWSGSKIIGSIGNVNFAVNFNRNETTLSNIISSGSTFELKLRGLQPGSKATATIFSTPTKLGTFTVNTSGKLNAVANIPKTIPSGLHRLRIELVNENGEAVTVWLGLRVRSTINSLPATGTSTNHPITAATIFVVAGLLLLGASRKRRMMI